jgi:hypothetical protein
MIHVFLVLALPGTLCVTGSGPTLTTHNAARTATVHNVSVPSGDSLRTVYETGQQWEEFYAGVDRRREVWSRNRDLARVPPDLLARAQKAGGPWRILVITEPGCSDSANSVPYLARLVQETPGLELRLVNSTVGKPWLEAHRSADGRAATPTVLVLDGDFDIRGCWIEQPVALQTIWLPIVARGTMSEELDTKMSWYADDAGRELLREFVEVLEGAQTGEIVCPGL